VKKRADEVYRRRRDSDQPEVFENFPEIITKYFIEKGTTFMEKKRQTQKSKVQMGGNLFFIYNQSYGNYQANRC
jgi:hypothetical protein